MQHKHLFYKMQKQAYKEDLIPPSISIWFHNCLRFAISRTLVLIEFTEVVWKSQKRQR